jgi:hypothetical protein
MVVQMHRDAAEARAILATAGWNTRLADLTP